MNNDPIKEFLKTFSTNPNISNDVLLKKYPYLKPEKLTRARAFALGYNSGEYEEEELKKNFSDVVSLFPSEASPIASVGELAANAAKQQSVTNAANSFVQGAEKVAGNLFGGEETLTERDAIKIKDYLTGTAQEQRNSEQLTRLKGKTLQPGLTEVKKAKTLSEKDVTNKAMEKIQDPLMQVWIRNSPDPIGGLRADVEKQNSALEVSIDNFNQRVENSNEQRVNSKLSQIITDNFFHNGSDAAEFLKTRSGLNTEALNSVEVSTIQPKNETERIALQKVKRAKEINALLNQYSLEEAALRLQNPTLDNHSFYHYRDNGMHNATLGAALHGFLQDPDVLERAEKDPKVRQQYLLGEQTLHAKYPQYANSLVANKIAQYREDKGKNSWFANDPDEEDIDKQIEEMNADPDWKLSPSELKTYQKGIRPLLQAGGGSGVIKTTGFVESLGSGIEEGVSGITKSLNSTVNAVTLDKFKDLGLLENDEDKRKRLVNEQYSALTVTPKQAATSIASGIGHFTGYMLPMIATGAVGRTLGMTGKGSEALSMYLMFEGQNAEHAMMAHPDDKAAQVLHTGLATLGDMFLMRLLPVNKLSNSLRQAFSGEVKTVVNDLASHRITEAVAKETLLEKFGTLVKNTAINNVKTANVMTAYNGFHQGLDALFGAGEDKSLQDVVNENIQAWKTNFLNATLLSAVHAPGVHPKLKASAVREIAENHEKYQVLINESNHSPEKKGELLRNLELAVRINKDLNEHGELTGAKRDKFMLLEMARQVLGRREKENTVEFFKEDIKQQRDRLLKEQENLLKGLDNASEFESYQTEIPKTKIEEPETGINEKSKELIQDNPEREMAALETELAPETVKDVSEKVLPENEAQNASESIVETKPEAKVLEVKETPERIEEPTLEISDTPLEKDRARKVADKLREWATLIEGDKSALKSDLLALPKAVVSTLLKGAAEIVEAGGTMKKAFDHVVEKVKAYYAENNITKESKEVLKETRALFESVGFIESKPSDTIKQSINRATSSKVKSEVVMNELTAIKKQAKDFARGLKAGVKEGIVEGRIEGLEKGIDIGARQGLTQGYEIAQKEMQRNDRMKDALRGKIANLFNIAVKEGVFTGDVKSSVLQAAIRKLNAAKTPSQLLSFVEYTGELLENIDYEKEIQAGNSLRSSIRSALKSKEKNADTRAIIREFSQIKPESVENIKAYNELAAKVLAVARGVKVSGGVEGVKVKNESFEVDNKTIQDFIDGHWEFREKESKQRLAEQYEDLVEAGVIDPKVMSLSEMKELVEAINGPEDALQKAAEKFAGEEARVQALRRVLEYQRIGLTEYETKSGNTFTGEELKVLKNLRSIDLQKLDAPQLAKLNDVINNIVINDSFTGSGEVAILSEVQRDTKVLQDKIKASPVKDLGSINNVFLQGFASNNLMQEFIFKSSKIAAEVQRLTGISDIFNGHAKAKLTQDAAVKEYLKLKKEVGGKDDALNRFRRGVFADVVNNFGGSKSEVNAEFNRRKRWIEQTAERLKSSDVKEEQREGEFIQRVYEELLEGSNSASDVKAKLMQVAPANVKLVEFWRKKFADREALTRESAEIYNNRVWEGVENYTATKLKGVASGGGVKEVGDMFDSLFINQSINNKVAGSKNQKTRAKNLPKDSVLDLDFDNVQSRAFYETNLDVETTRAVLKAKHFLKQPEAVKIFGNSRNRKIIVESIRRSIALQRGTTMPVDAFEKAAYKTVNFVRAKGIRLALGSVFQLLKQYPSVAISTLGNLGSDAPLFLKALTISNKLPLFEQFNIGLRGETKAGFNREIDLGVIERTDLGGATQKAIHLMEDVGHKLSDIALATLTKSDVSVARTSWLAYYMKDLRRQKVDIEKIDWEKEHLNPNEEAAAYAEQMVSRSQNANDATSMPNFLKDQRGIKGIVTSMILPFSGFAINQRMRMTSDVHKILFGGEKKEAIKSLVATTAEIAAFNAIKVFVIGALTTAGARSLAQIFQMWDEDDEKAADNKSEVTINDSITVSDKTKKWLANSISDFFFSGLGSAPQYGAQQGMNWLYENAVTETFKDRKENKYPSLFFTKRKGETDWSSWGVLGIPLEQGYDAYQSADRLLFGAKHHTKEGVHRDEMSENEQKLYTLAFLIDALSVVGVGDAELNNVNRKLKSMAEKKMEKKYGGNEFTLTTNGFGKNVEEGEVNFKKLSSIDQVKAWQVASDEQKNEWAKDLHDIDVLEEAEKKERNAEFFEDESNREALEEMKQFRKKNFKRFY